jgi:energy-coupling factor transporter ATP-binding protein EcfA2
MAASAAAGRTARPRSVEEVDPPPVAARTLPEPCSPGQRPVPSPPALLRVRDLAFRYGRRQAPVLAAVSFDIGQGEVVALLGANGSGKTTLLRVLAGLSGPASGEIAWTDGAAAPSMRVGLVFQDPDLMLQAPTVAAEVHWGPSQLAREDAAQREWEARLLTDLNLAGLEREPPHALSRGQRQRVAVAALLASRPVLLCLDEPTTGQDRANVEALIGALRPARAVLVATQDASFALELADRVLVLHGGRIVADGHPFSVLWLAEKIGAPPVRRAEQLAAFLRGDVG